MNELIEILCMYYNNKNVDAICDLLSEFDSNTKTSDFNEFLKKKGYK
tara:strand:+ start:498 stop:638 length:141 start_codon:yes stop_codon:yes gene_type:complete